MATSNFILIIITIVLGFNLIASGVPVEKVDTTSNIVTNIDNETSNETEKEM